MTVLDSSAVIDYLLGIGAVDEVDRLLARAPSADAPDTLVFEVLAALRRKVQGGHLDRERAAAAVEDLGDMSLELFPSLPLRRRAWDLRDNLTTADAMFVALAELLEEPLVTKDRGLAAAARRHTGIEVVELASR